MEMNLLISMVLSACRRDGQDSDNQLFRKGGLPAKLIDGMEPTFRWISSQISGSL